MKLRAKYSVVIFLAFFVLSSALISFQIKWSNHYLIDKTRDDVSQAIQGAWQVVNEKRRLVELLVTLETKKQEGVFFCGDVNSTFLSIFSNEFSDRVSGLNNRETTSGFERSHKGQVFVIALRKINGVVKAAAIDLAASNLVVDQIQKTIFSSNVGTVTIFSNNIRVSTTVMNGEHQRAIGTKVSKEVEKIVLRKNRSWIGDAVVLDEVYITRYDPISNFAGQTIGMLYVGKLKSVYQKIQNRLLLEQIGIILLITAASLLLILLVTGQTIRKVKVLGAAANTINGGNLEVRVPVIGKDELDLLGEKFNQMALKLKEGRERITSQKDSLSKNSDLVVDLVTFISFDLKNKLSSAVFNIDLLREGSFGPVSAEQEEGIDVIKNELFHINDFILTYMQVANIDRNQLSVNRVEVNFVNDVLNGVVHSLKAMLSRSKVSVEIDISDDLIIPTDRNLMRIIYRNILATAIDHSCEDSVITLGATSAANMVIPSINLKAKSDRVGIFENLFSATDGEKLEVNLFVVKRIIENHGGKVWVEVENNQYVSIRFNLYV